MFKWKLSKPGMCAQRSPGKPTLSPRSLMKLNGSYHEIKCFFCVSSKSDSPMNHFPRVKERHKPVCIDVQKGND